MADAADQGMIDLTAVSRPDIRVKLTTADGKSEIRRIPGNAPSGLLIDMMVLLREIDKQEPDDLEAIASLRDELQEKVDDLFAMRDPDYADGDVKLSDEEMGMLVASMFQRYYDRAKPDGDGEGGEGDGDRPTEAAEEPEAEPKSASTPARQRSAARSPRRSSAAKRKPRSRSSTSSPT